jgi:hypothetical protein
MHMFDDMPFPEDWALGANLYKYITIIKLIIVIITIIWMILSKGER